MMTISASCQSVVKGFDGVVAIGASTGGPSTILKILSRLLRSDFNLPIIIVQHIDLSFVAGFASWLASELEREIKIISAADYLYAGGIFVANASGNLELNGARYLHYAPAAAGQVYVPNIDHFFSSLARLDIPSISLLLTGMGSDGAQGLKRLAEAGRRTCVQSAQSCVVSGMPDAALALHRTHSVCDPEELADEISRFASKLRSKSNG